MSGPVFVIDAQGTPLMPTSPAAARRLLRQGKARRVRHHAFTIIQLAQAIHSPVLRPVIFGITLHPSSIEFFLITTGAHDIFPLLNVVADLSTTQAFSVRRQSASIQPSVPLKHTPYVCRNAQLHTEERAIYTAVSTVAAVTTAFQSLVPLSHGMLLNMCDTPSTYVHSCTLSVTLRRVGLSIASDPQTLPPDVPSALGAVLRTWCTHPSWTQRFAAVVKAIPYTDAQKTDV